MIDNAKIVENLGDIFMVFSMQLTRDIESLLIQCRGLMKVLFDSMDDGHVAERRGDFMMTFPKVILEDLKDTLMKHKRTTIIFAIL